MHNQGGYIQGPQGSTGQVVRPQQASVQLAQVQPAPQQHQQHHVMPSPGQFPPFMMHTHQTQFVPGGHFMVPQHVPAAQLPQLPAQLFQHPQDQSCLLVIPMHFNGRDMSYSLQTGVIVPPGASTFHGGFHIIHQSHFAPPQMQQQPHPQQMPNGFGPGQQAAGGSPAGSSGFGDAVSTSSSRENATRNSPVNAGSNNNVAHHAVNMAVDPRTMMYPYPSQSLSQYAVGPGMPMHPGFVPQQMPMHSQIVNAYGGQQAVHAASQSDENVQGAGHTGDEQGERQHSVQEMANGVQEAEHRSVSSAQSRSTSYSSNMDIENNVGHSGPENTSAAEPDVQDNRFERSRTPSPEDVTLCGSVDGVKEGISNGEVNHEREASSFHDGLENGAYGENVDHHVQATVQAEIRAEAMTPSKLRPGSQGIASPTLQMDPIKASALSGSLRSNTDSPLSTRSTNSPHTLTASNNQTEQANSAAETPRDTGSPVTPTVVDNAPKSWAAIITTQAGPKAPFPTAYNNKSAARPPVVPRSEAAVNKPTSAKNNNSYQGNEDGYGSGYRNDGGGSGGGSGGGYGGQRGGQPSGQASGQASGQDRHYEYPRLQTEEADTFPDAQQVYIKDIPTSVSSTSIASAMKAVGNLVDVRLRYHQDRNSRFCFVLFDNRSAVDRLLEKGTIAVDGKTLVVQKKMKTNANAYPRMYRNSNR